MGSAVKSEKSAFTFRNIYSNVFAGWVIESFAYRCVRHRQNHLYRYPFDCASSLNNYTYNEI